MNTNTYLLSLVQLAALGLEFRFQQHGCYIFRGGSLWSIASRRNFVYYIQEQSADLVVHYPASNNLSSFQAMPTTDSPNDRGDVQPDHIWHKRLGHLNKRYIGLLPKQAEGVDIGSSRKHKYDCEDCLRASQRCQISCYPARTPSDILEIIYADICGPIHVTDF